MMVFLEVFVNHLRSLACALLLAGTCFAIPSAPDAADRAAINEAVSWIRATPRIRAEYDYIMTCRLRLLFFWVGRDDLGGGYIKAGQAADDPSLRMIQLLFGSDPAKAPRAINRWGAGTEVVRLDGNKTPQSSAFVGFMKSSKGESVSAMQRELAHEKSAGKHLFEAIVSRVDGAQAISTIVPFYSDKDYDLRQLGDAQKLALDQLGDSQARKFRRLDGPARRRVRQTRRVSIDNGGTAGAIPDRGEDPCLFMLCVQRPPLYSDFTACDSRRHQGRPHYAEGEGPENRPIVPRPQGITVPDPQPGVRRQN